MSRNFTAIICTKRRNELAELKPPTSQTRQDHPPAEKSCHAALNEGGQKEEVATVYRVVGVMFHTHLCAKLDHVSKSILEGMQLRTWSKYQTMSLGSLRLECDTCHIAKQIYSGVTQSASMS